MTLLLAAVLSVLLIVPADGRRFEWVRALHGTPAALPSVLVSRVLITLAMTALVALLTDALVHAGPLGRQLAVFAGVMTAAWLWMWFWIRTYVADPAHRQLVLGPTSVMLGSALSVTLWLVVFTLQALLVAWLDMVTWWLLWQASWVFVALDALWLGVLGLHPLGHRHIQSERRQRRLNRASGSLLLVTAVWALVVVFGL